MDMNTEFIDALASSAPTPGGGGASAYVGALASACASMVGELTLGKKRYADVEPEVKESLVRLKELRERLLELVDADAEAFEPLSAAYRMPKDTPEQKAAKHEAEQAALVPAIEVPIEIMQNVSEVVGIIEFMSENGSRMALSDAGVAAAFARAASDGASLNIYINAKSMDDQEAAERYREQANILFSETRIHCDAIFDYVKGAVS